MLLELFQPSIMIPWLLGMVFGIFVGSTPGLTATMAVALIVPLSYHLPPAAGLAMIIGVSFTAIFAGDIPATFLRIPGTPASAAATLDGHALARRGRGVFALQLDLFCSAIGGLIGVTLLALVAPQLARVALKFSSYEYFWLGLMGLAMSALVSQGGLLRGLTSAMLGLALATVGMDTSGTPRFSFGVIDLIERLEVIPVMIGLFGLAEVLRSLSGSALHGQAAQLEQTKVTLGEVLGTIWRRRTTVATSSLVGTVIGALPGAGADVAAWGAYGIAERMSNDEEEFGAGAIDGVVAPTSANNAAVAGAWIPALVFGVPGDAVTAIVLGALMVYNIKPGPQIFETSGPLVRQLLLIAFITQLLLIPAGLVGLRAFQTILRLPRRHVLAGVLVFSVVGSYAIRSSLFDVYVMIAAGALGWFLESQRVPLAPLVLGLILGNLVEENLRKGLIGSDGDLTPFFTRPICVALIVALVACLAAPLLRRLFSRSTRAAA
ncbi:MAG: tripartite tricarboxylate transporter permease [Planctomycetales bacterium]|nr:tripartite tricarboxylate transporter permease [Planctomycetales bacterium]